MTVPVWFRPLDQREIERMARQLEEMRRLEELHKAAGRQVRPKQ